MKSKIVSWGCYVLLFVTSLSCTQSNKVTRTTVAFNPTINLSLLEQAQSNRFVDMDYGIRLIVKDKRSEAKKRILYKHDSYLTSMPNVNVYPDVISFVNESIKNYMRTMGFDLYSDISSDYIMNLTVNEFNVNYYYGVGWSGIVNMNLDICDKNNKPVYPNVSITGRFTERGQSDDFATASRVINTAFVKALKDIDWDRIAFLLKRTTPAAEKNKQVTGDGSTSLEHLVINWQVTSRPAGADIYWRVISSTPEVKNTNSNYKSTTPYESTETFDIIGLTYNNSGNVQIEILCEKAGYLPQKKVFNLRSAIDQKSINAHFTLVKDE